MSKLRQFNGIEWVEISGAPGKDGKTPIKGVDYFDGKSPTKDELIALIKPLIPQPIKGEPGKDGADASFDPNALFDTFIERIKKEKVLDMSNIKNSDSFLFNGTRYKTHELMHGAGATVTFYDLSAQLNGVLNSFAFPGGTIVDVKTSSFPYTYRPTVDYTATASSITFTSEIDAATSLASGQTLILLYVAS